MGTRLPTHIMLPTNIADSTASMSQLGQSSAATAGRQVSGPSSPGTRQKSVSTASTAGRGALLLVPTQICSKPFYVPPHLCP